MVINTKATSTCPWHMEEAYILTPMVTLMKAIGLRTGGMGKAQRGNWMDLGIEASIMKDSNKVKGNTILERVSQHTGDNGSKI